jgi:hypothetical protein
MAAIEKARPSPFSAIRGTSQACSEATNTPSVPTPVKMPKKTRTCPVVLIVPAPRTVPLSSRPSLPEPKLPSDQIAQAIADFGVPGHGRLSARTRIEIDIMPAPVAVQTASSGFKLADEVSPLHTKTSISLVCASGDGGGPSSSTIIR